MRACSGPIQLLATARSLDQWRVPKPAAAATRCWRVAPCSLTRLRLSDTARATLAQQNPGRTRILSTRLNSGPGAEYLPLLDRWSLQRMLLIGCLAASSRPTLVLEFERVLRVAQQTRPRPQLLRACERGQINVVRERGRIPARTYSSALIPKVNSTSMGLPQFATAALLGGCVVNEATCVACCCSRVSLLKALLEYHAQGLCTC